MINNRYHKQIILPDFGISSQNKISQAKVLVIGVGGLGCPVLQCLTAMGVGTLGIVDFDIVDISNLQRQFLFTEASIGKYKADIAKETLTNNNSKINIIAIAKKLTNENIISLFKPYDIIVDCTDNFETRYLVNDSCIILNKPLVYGAIYQYEGQLSVFNFNNKASYRDLFPNPPQMHEAPTCVQSGVLCTISSLIGTMQANEVIKLITGIGEVLSSKLLIINILDYTTKIINFK